MAKTRKRYQIFPALTSQQYETLEEDIKARGVMVPVEIDDAGYILDGHTRAEIADKHDLKYKTITRRFQTEEQKEEHIIKLNLARRQMSEVTWGQAFRRLCKQRGVKLGRGKGNPHAGESKTATMAVLAKEVGVSERTAQRRVKAAEEYDTLPDQTKAAIAQGKIRASDVRKEHREPKTTTTKPKVSKGDPAKALKDAWHKSKQDGRLAFFNWKPFQTWMQKHRALRST